MTFLTSYAQLSVWVVILHISGCECQVGLLSNIEENSTQTNVVGQGRGVSTIYNYKKEFTYIKNYST